MFVLYEVRNFSKIRTTTDNSFPKRRVTCNQTTFTLKSHNVDWLVKRREVRFNELADVEYQ